MELGKYSLKTVHLVDELDPDVFVSDDLLKTMKIERDKMSSTKVINLKHYRSGQLKPVFPDGKLMYHLLKEASYDTLKKYVPLHLIDSLKESLSDPDVFFRWHCTNGYFIDGIKLTRLLDIDDPGIMKIVTKVNRSSPILDLLYNSFISLDVQHDYEVNEYVMTEFKSHILNMKIVHENQLSSKLLKDINFLVNYMYNRWYHDVKMVHLTILLSKRKKMLRRINGTVITPCHINSGVTIFGKAVCIWREEEITKVLIHELIHLFGYDIKGSSNKVRKWVMNRFGIEGMCNPNEALTEMMAVIIHTAFISLRLSLPLLQLAKYELGHQFIQMAKLLIFFGLDSLADLKHVKQSTNGISYFFIKTALINCFHDNLDRYTRINETELLYLISKSLNNHHLGKKIKDVMGKLSTVPSYATKNLRMTALQLNYL